MTPRFVILFCIFALSGFGAKALAGGKKPLPTPRVAPPVLAASMESPKPLAPVSEKEKKEIQAWCAELNQLVQKKYRWPEDACSVTGWRVGGHSVQGRPLVYAVYGSDDLVDTTLILSMVHGDESTPLFIGLRLAKWLQDNQDVFKNSRIVVAPLLNPDGFFKQPQSRVNSHGVDINRNFNTKDWDRDALQAWKNKFRSDPRRFPGEKPESEPETQFQIELVRQVRPLKIISVHAPLNFLDYDGPNTLSLNNFPQEYVKRCLQLRSKIKAITSRFFPGSLGNYSGQERGIPTFTLELPTSDPRHALDYWRRFKPGIRTVIDYKISDQISRKSGVSGG